MKTKADFRVVPPAPHYAVGDRFAHPDGRFFEVVEVDGNWAHLARSWSDERGFTKRATLATGGWQHVSGPTYKAARKPALTCNCSAQVTGSEHRDWCRTKEAT